MSLVAIKIYSVSHIILIQNGVLFLQIHEGVQASQKYRKPNKYKSRKQRYGSANREQKYGKPHEYKSRKSHYSDATR